MQARLFQGNVVVVVQVVEPDNLPALGKVTCRHMVADEPGRAGDEDGRQGQAPDVSGPGEIFIAITA